MSNNSSLLISNLADKFNISKMIEKVDFIKNCSAGIVLFTVISGLLAFENYRKDIYSKNEVINKINEKNKIIEKKLDELIESNKLIIQMLEKHDVVLNKITNYPFVIFDSKNSLNYSSSNLSALTFHSEKEKQKEDENLYDYINYYCSEPNETEVEDQELLNECYDALPCNNSKKASGLNRLFGWN
jgi:hypothetical protein